jgi:hypothetical protein
VSDNKTIVAVRPSRKDFEQLLHANGYPKRLIKKLSKRWAEVVADDEESPNEDAEAVLDSIKRLISKTDTVS